MKGFIMFVLGCLIGFVQTQVTHFTIEQDFWKWLFVLLPWWFMIVVLIEIIWSVKSDYKYKFTGDIEIDTISVKKDK